MSGFFQIYRHSFVNAPMRLHWGKFSCPTDQPENYVFEPHRTLVINHTYFQIPFEESSSWDDVKQSKLHVGD